MVAAHGDEEKQKTWHYWPFGDVFGGSLAPLLVDTLGSPTSPLPKDPRSLIANPHAAQLAPVHCALVPVAETSSEEATSDMLLVNLGTGPWICGLSISVAAGSKGNALSLRIPGTTMDSHEFRCDLRRGSCHSGVMWLLEDCPGDTRRQLAAVVVRNPADNRGMVTRLCRCGKAKPAEELSVTLVIPNVNPNGACAQFKNNELVNKFSSQQMKHLLVFEGTLSTHGGSGGQIDISMDLVGPTSSVLRAESQPQCGPWEFHFGAPLSAAQALACALVAARYAPQLRGAAWGSQYLKHVPVKASEEDEGAVSWPSYWRRTAGEETALYETLPAMRFLQGIMTETFRLKRTRDRKDSDMPVGLHVVAVLRMENPTQWKRYQYRKLLMRRDRQNKPVTPIIPPLETMSRMNAEVMSELDADVNEAYLFHGTTPNAAIAIQASGFNLGLAGKHRGKMFGRGVYFAEESSKADEYAEPDEEFGLRCMLFCRVACGETHLAVEPCADMERQVDRRKFDCTIGDRRQAVGTYREIIVYDGSQAYAEYAVLYKRISNVAAAAPRLVDTTGDGLADTLFFDSSESGVIDRKERISGAFAEYLKHMSGETLDSVAPAESREDAAKQSSELGGKTVAAFDTLPIGDTAPTVPHASAPATIEALSPAEPAATSTV